MDKQRLMELAGVPTKTKKIDEMGQMIPLGIVEDLVHNAINDVLASLKIQAPKHTIEDAIASAMSHAQGEAETHNATQEQPAADDWQRY